MHDLDETLLFLFYRADPFAPWLALMVGLSVVGGGYGLFGIVPFAFVRRARRRVGHLLGAIALTTIVVFALKRGLGRARPYQAVAGVQALGLAPPHDPSFPSGHAAGSACVAGFLADRKRPARSIALATAAALVGLSRVVLGVHYPLDVMAGAALGATIGALASRRLAREEALGIPKTDEEVVG